MKRILITSPLLFLLNFLCFSQAERIIVTETTLKLASLESKQLYFGFCEGDQIIFNLEIIKGKYLTEVEILEYPNTSIFMDYKTKSIRDKSILVKKTGVYKFNLNNSAVNGRIFKVKIERIPVIESTKNFNTSVSWKTVYDSTYTTVQEKYLISKDTVVHNITDQVAKVHSYTNVNGNKTIFNFTLPENTVSWSYYVGVDQAGQEALDQATKEIASKAAPIVAKIPGYGPLAALALGSTSYISQIQKGEDIDYYICDGNNANLFSRDQVFKPIKNGKVINDFSRMTTNLKGSYFFCLSNDNAVTGVTVTVKVTAIAVTENWGVRQVRKYTVNSREEPFLMD